MDAGDEDSNLGTLDEGAFPTEEEALDAYDGIVLTPGEHQRIKDLVNGEHLDRVKGRERRYLVAGSGEGTDAGVRRTIVYDLLDARTNPSAVATRLEDFGLGDDELRLWARVFDILCAEATHVVTVLEDFDGGYVWELGLLFAPTYREKVWILKRRYADPETERERYDNGMGASHVELLLSGPRAHEWTDEGELRTAVEEIP